MRLILVGLDWFNYVTWELVMDTYNAMEKQRILLIE